MGLENFAEFVDHRYDQAGMTSLGIERSIKTLGGSSSTIYRHRNINFFVEAYLASKSIAERASN